ncbi:unnamed protein product, partial [Ectocarpus sp. 6 AP-2014]
ENYGVSNAGWEEFVKGIKDTNITNAYLSEDLPCGLKEDMKAIMRVNRRKHALHKSLSNVDVIRRVTHMWWNPYRSQELQRALASCERNSP